jgi:RNA polymerase sigma-70 factor (ECF subfamily)
LELEAVERSIAERLDLGDRDGASAIAIREYGPGILGYLVALLRDEDDAADVFSIFSVDFWRGIGGFRRRCSARTWAYKLARNAAMRFLASPRRARTRRLRTSEVSALAAEVVSASAPAARARREAGAERLRAQLEPDEQTLLILRIDRQLSWKEIAEVLVAEGTPVDGAALRKRYERLKLRLRRMAEAQGLLST